MGFSQPLSSSSLKTELWSSLLFSSDVQIVSPCAVKVLLPVIISKSQTTLSGQCSAVITALDWLQVMNWVAFFVFVLFK